MGPPPGAKPPAGAEATPAAAGAQAKPAPKMGGFGPAIAIIVTGATNNNYYSVGGMRYSRRVQIDPWR